MWQYLQEAELKKYSFSASYRTYYGRFVERLARRVLKEWMSFERMAGLFPEVEIISSERFHPYGYGKKYGKIFRGIAAMKSQLDSLWVLHVNKPSGGFGKYAVGFEIKSGASSISKEHCDFWRDLILRPETYIDKCEKIRLFILWVHGLDDPCMFYTIKEIIPEDFPNQGSLLSRVSMEQDMSMEEKQ